MDFIALIVYYLGQKVEIHKVEKELEIYKKKIRNVFGENDIIKILEIEIKNYLYNAVIEKKIIESVIKNFKFIYSFDMYSGIEILEKNYKERYLYLERLLSQLDLALAMELDYKFYAPVKKLKTYSLEDIESILNYFRGFNENNVINFLLKEEIFEDEKELLSPQRDVLKLDLEGETSTDFYGIFDNKVVIPVVKDEKTALIAVHELVHYALLLKEKEINNEEIVNSEDLPVFYEILYQDSNKFTFNEIHTTDNALALFSDYKKELFDVQIKKLEKLIKQRTR